MDAEESAAQTSDAFKPAAGLGAGPLKKLGAPPTVALLGFDELGAKKFSYWLAERGEFAPLVRASEELRTILKQRGAAVALVAEEALSGPRELEALLRTYPTIPILVGMLDFDPARADALLRAGARAVAPLVSASPEGLRAIVELGAHGLLGSAILPPKAIGSRPLLSGYLREVASRLVAGQSLAQIAEQLHLTRGSVRTYRWRIYQELGVNDVAELATLLPEQEQPNREDRPVSPTPLAYRRLVSDQRNWARPSQVHMASALGVGPWR